MRLLLTVVLFIFAVPGCAHFEKPTAKEMINKAELCLKGEKVEVCAGKYDHGQIQIRF